MNIKTINNVAIYARVSTKDKTQNPETQLKDLREFCEKMNWEFTEYVDYATGTNDNRPGYQKLMIDIDHGKIDLLLVWSIDRLGRNTKQLINDWYKLKSRGVHFRSYSEFIDTTMVGGELFYQIISVVSGLFSDEQKRAIAAGIRRARKEGKQIGRPKISQRKKRRILKAKKDYPYDSYGALAKRLKVPKSTIYKILTKQ